MELIIKFATPALFIANIALLAWGIKVDYDHKKQTAHRSSRTRYGDRRGSGDGRRDGDSELDGDDKPS